MCILRTRNFSQKINSKMFRESLVLYISINRLHVWHFLYFILHIAMANCLICVISWLLGPNLSSCISLVIVKCDLKSQYTKVIQLWPLTVELCQSEFSVSFGRLIIKLSKNAFPPVICRSNENTAEIWCFAPTSVLRYCH